MELWAEPRASGYHEEVGRQLQMYAKAGREEPDASGEARAAAASLTARELQIARLLTYGLTDAAIAAHLNISTRTASKHVENLRSKLGLRSRWQVATWANAEGIVDREA